MNRQDATVRTMAKNQPADTAKTTDTPVFDLNAKLPNVLIYLGRRTLRHKDEPELKNEDALVQAPWTIPHVYVQFLGAKQKDVLEQAAGKQGVMVDNQKVMRGDTPTKDPHTLREVQAFRDSMIAAYPEIAAKHLTEAAKKDVAAEGITEDELIQGIKTAPEAWADKVEPFLVLKFTEAGQRLNVPKQPKDMLDVLKGVTFVWEGLQIEGKLLKDHDEETQLRLAPILYEQIQTVSLK